MRKLAVILVFALLACVSLFAQAPATTQEAVLAVEDAPPTVGVKGSWEVCAGVGQMFFTDTSNQNFTIDAANFLAHVDARYWISDHAAVGGAFYHDTVDLAKLTDNLPVGSHVIWGFDFICVYTLKTFDPGWKPELPPDVVDYLNKRAKRLTVDSIGGVGLIYLDGQKTLSYFLGAETNYWFDEKFSAKLITAVRHSQYMGVNKTYPEVRLLAAYRF